MNFVSDNVVDQTKQVMCMCVKLDYNFMSVLLKTVLSIPLQALTNMKHVLEAANSDLASGKWSHNH